MQLTDTQFVRTFAFVELLKLTLARQGQPMPTDEEPLPALNERAVMALQDGTEANASVYAEQFFPDVVFADDTRRETEPPAEEAIEDEGDREPTEAELAAVAAKYLNN